MAQAMMLPVVPPSVDHALNEVRDASGGPVQAIFISRALRAVAMLARTLDVDELGEAAAQPTDYSLLLAALSNSGVLAVLNEDNPLSEARLAGLRGKKELIEAEGGALTVEEAADALGLTRQGVDRRRRAGKLLALSMGKRGYLYPAWQFTQGGTLPGLEETLDVFQDIGPWAQLTWFISPNTRLGGESPLDMLRAGEIGRVVEAASVYGEQGAD